MDYTRLLHGRELCLGSSQLVQIKVTSFFKNLRPGLGEEMVGDRMARQRGGKTVEGQDIWELKEQIGDTLGSG